VSAATPIHARNARSQARIANVAATIILSARQQPPVVAAAPSVPRVFLHADAVKRTKQVPRSVSRSGHSRAAMVDASATAVRAGTASFSDELIVPGASRLSAVKVMVPA